PLLVGLLVGVTGTVVTTPLLVPGTVVVVPTGGEAPTPVVKPLPEPLVLPEEGSVPPESTPVDPVPGTPMLVLLVGVVVVMLFRLPKGFCAPLPKAVRPPMLANSPRPETTRLLLASGEETV